MQHIVVIRIRIPNIELDKATKLKEKIDKLLEEYEGAESEMVATRRKFPEVR